MIRNVEFIPILECSLTVQERVRLWRNSEAARTQMVHQEEITPEEHRQWLESQESAQARCRCCVAFHEKVPFGVITLNQMDFLNRHSDWGMYIGESEFRGKGLAKILLMEILLWGFESLGLHRLYTSVLANNVNALGLYLKGGFEVEGIWRHHLLVHGEPKDLYWISMLEDKWRSRRETIRVWAASSAS